MFLASAADDADGFSGDARVSWGEAAAAAEAAVVAVEVSSDDDAATEPSDLRDDAAAPEVRTEAEPVEAIDARDAGAVPAAAVAGPSSSCLLDVLLAVPLLTRADLETGSDC